ncbi:MAG: hypothetical protein GKC04_07600 [Methanomicrobiales archaeon]|nr:hypothetical protein [Methanomicrobiales archaeon]
MAEKKHLTIGITVNLEHYENLRLDVEGDVGTQEDVDALVACLDEILGRFGRNDPETAERVDAYRRRVLGRTAAPAAPPAPAGAAQPPVQPPEPAPPVAEHPVIETIHNGGPAEALYHTPADAPCVGEDADHAGERVTPPSCDDLHDTCNAAASVPQPKPKEAPAADTFVCSACGTAISKTQEQLSQLFMGRSLCKKCMDLKE